MSNIIDFLERLGRDAQLRHAPSVAVEQALVRAHVPEVLRSALLADDPRRLELLLGAQANVCCMVHAPDEEEEEEDDSDDEKPTVRSYVLDRAATAT